MYPHHNKHSDVHRMVFRTPEHQFPGWHLVFVMPVFHLIPICISPIHQGLVLTFGFHVPICAALYSFMFAFYQKKKICQNRVVLNLTKEEMSEEDRILLLWEGQLRKESDLINKSSTGYGLTTDSNWMIS